MKVIADLQLHSKYSRAVSPQMVIPEIARWARRKGIGLIATGDWTHPLWMREISANLEEEGNGLLRLKKQKMEAGKEDGSWKVEKSNIEHQASSQASNHDPLFLLATEISSIYSQGGRLRRIHNLVWAPSISVAEKITAELLKRGANLIADGRPIVGLSSIQLIELVLTIDPNCLFIPAHAWTPWFSLYGSESGFDSIAECFDSFAKYIYAIETGLSSDPAMNWRIKELDNRAILSFSDAHSGPKLGREATVFNLRELSYQAIREAIVQDTQKTQKIGVPDLSVRQLTDQKIRLTNSTDSLMHRNTESSEFSENRISATIEFYPEEGKYHYTGHRNCKVKQTPQETKARGTTCPVCGKKLTVGVMHRVEALAGRSEDMVGVYREGMWVKSKLFPHRPPYTMMVPLQEILAEAIGGLVGSQKVQAEYTKLTDQLGGEFLILLKTDLDDIVRVSGERVAEAIDKVRQGTIVVDPGFDGEFGKVKIWSEEKKGEERAEKKEQLSLF